MYQSRFEFLPERCVGCFACVSACLDEYAEDLRTSVCRREITQTETPPFGGEKARITWHAASCLHCAQPACLQACPMGCIHRDEDTGTVQLNTDLCIGCRSCADACPHRGIFFDKGTPVKCSGCRERLLEDRRPRCAAACPCGAIVFHRKET